MTRTIVFGNSGSGKSTLARRIAEQSQAAHLDLDTLAWKAPAVREELSVSEKRIRDFIAAHEDWVIEGCYASLIEIAAAHAQEIVFLNPGTATCQENCRSRPWEPHKYASKEEQDKNLEMLLGWVAQYESREDEFSLAAHQKLFRAFEGQKREITSNEEAGQFRRPTAE
ncbi:AAA family ATPase [Pelagicoccus sp. SDUM812005]|uniref:AAA family ATPase n=1 Tax=Pelagicoccus sp. SDUM812005 TaxID=3041257 RepID=UPI0028107DA5|nr:AAA family ATPase [Pelagicoccus sp. SDUM812005]MDQ8179341.1 AAA family ATPase [Pelagicoccus sp. SDUM812005]